MSTETPAASTPPSSAAPANPSPSPAVSAATPANIPASTPTPTTSSPTAAAAPTRPDWLPEKYFDATKGANYDDFGKHYSELATRDAAEQVRRGSVPAPEAYKTELPKDFVLPTGVDYKFDDADPALADFRKFANETGMSQEQFSKSLGFYAAAKVSDQATTAAAHAAEISKLGPNGPSRVTALGTFFDGIGAPEMKTMLVTAGIVQAAEKLVSKFSSQGSASFSQAHREPGNANGRVSEEAYNKMSQAERLDYSRKFDQSQFQKSA